jgi:DNA-binding CsgD family transcriptional regulator
MLGSGKGAVVLAGPAGVGKTRLGTESLALAARAGFAPLRVAATAATSALPFGAFANLLPDLDPKTDRASLLRQIARSIFLRGEGKPVGLLVDDAHLLDESSAALTHQLAEGGHSFVIATLRSGEAASDAVVALWKDDLAERLELSPFSDSEVEDLLVAALGGPVDGATINLLRERTKGNALFLKELVLGAVDKGALQKVQGVWRLTGKLPLSSRLVEIVEGRLAALSDRDRDALEVLALGEPLELDLFQGLKPDVDIEALEKRGMLRIEQDGRRLLLRLDHPLHGEVLRSKLSALGMRRSARALAEAAERTGAHRRTDILRTATWRLQGGGPFNPELMLGAAFIAKQRGDLTLTERLARSAIDAGAGFDAKLLLGQLWQQGRAAEAEQQLRALIPLAKTDSERALLASSHIEVLDLGLKNPDGALWVAEEAEAAIEDLECRDQITVARARILGRSGRHDSAVALIEPLLDRAQGRILIAASFAAGTSMNLTGQFARVIEVTQRGYDTHRALTGSPMNFGPLVHQAFRCGALTNGGWLAEAKELESVFYAEAVKEGSPEEQGFFAEYQAMTALGSGRMETAARWAAEGAGVFRQMRWAMMERVGLTLLAFARAQQGEAPEARTVLADLDALGVPPTDVKGPMLLQARAWVEVAEGNLDLGVVVLGQAVDMARWSGAPFLECAALHDLARLGRAVDVADELRAAAAKVEGPLAPLRVAHTEALASANPPGLDQVSNDFEAWGAMLLAAEASADAAVAWRRTGEKRKATAAQLRSAALASLCEGAKTPALSTSVPVRASLTTRELEISRLAASGLSSHDIAERLCLSTRTVDNNLLSVYEKLGIQRRSDLAAALKGYSLADFEKE